MSKNKKKESNLNTKEEFDMQETAVEQMDKMFENLTGLYDSETEVEKDATNDMEEPKLSDEEEFVQMVNEGDLKEVLHYLSDSVKVVNSLGFGDSGNVVLVKDESGERLVTVAKIVGYRVQNVGDVAISYKTETWKKDANGEFKSAGVVERYLQPGETVDLSRKYMTIFCARPEISFELKNGKMVKGSSIKTAKTMDDMLESYYFKFDKDTGLSVNDDEVKLNIAEKVGDEWVVKKEYEELFGFLNNKEVKSTRQKGKSVSNQDLEAYRISKMLAEANIV